MGLQKISNSWNALMLKLVDYGIPVLILRDPFSQRPSLPFTMMILAILLEVMSMVGRLSALVGGIDKGSALQFLTTSAALYFGHSWVNTSTPTSTGPTQPLPVIPPVPPIAPLPPSPIGPVNPNMPQGPF